MSEELKPRPFCGAVPIIFLVNWTWIVRCENGGPPLLGKCGARVQVNTSSKAEAITAWNTRKESK